MRRVATALIRTYVRYRLGPDQLIKLSCKHHRRRLRVCSFILYPWHVSLAFGTQQPLAGVAYNNQRVHLVDFATLPIRPSHILLIHRPVASLLQRIRRLQSNGILKQSDHRY